MTLLQLCVNNNSTIFDLFENEETKHVTFKEILDCKCDEIFDEKSFDEKNFDEKTIEPNIPTETKLYKFCVSFADLVKPNYKTELLKMLTYDKVVNRSILELFQDFEESRPDQKDIVDKYFNLFKNLTLKELIIYNNRKKEEQLKIDTENKQEALKLEEYLNSLPSTFEKIKINFTKSLTNEKELIDFLNHYNITPKMLMDYIEDSTIFTNNLYDNDNYPFDLTFEICEAGADRIVDDFFDFMKYNINYQIMERYTQLTSINFLAIFEFKKLHLGSIGEISSFMNSSTSDDPNEIYITFGEFIEIKKKKVQFEIWEKV